MGELSLRDRGLGAAGPRRFDDPRPPDEGAQLLGRIGAGTGQERQAVEHGVDMGQGLVSDDRAHRVPVAGPLVGHCHQDGAGSAARLDQALEARERARLEGLLRIEWRFVLIHRSAIQPQRCRLPRVLSP